MLTEQWLLACCYHQLRDSRDAAVGCILLRPRLHVVRNVSQQAHSSPNPGCFCLAKAHGLCHWAEMHRYAAAAEKFVCAAYRGPLRWPAWTTTRPTCGLLSMPRRSHDAHWHHDRVAPGWHAVCAAHGRAQQQNGSHLNMSGTGENVENDARRMAVSKASVCPLSTEARHAEKRRVVRLRKMREL